MNARLAKQMLRIDGWAYLPVQYAFLVFVWARYAVNTEDHKLEKPSGGEDNGVEPMTFPQNLRDALTS